MVKKKISLEIRIRGCKRRQFNVFRRVKKEKYDKYGRIIKKEYRKIKGNI